MGDSSERGGSSLRPGRRLEVPVEELPVWLATPYHDLLHTTSERTQLHLILEVARASLCWLAGLALAEVLQDPGDAGEPLSVDWLRKRLTEPRMDGWLSLLGELYTDRPAGVDGSTGVFDIYPDVARLFSGRTASPGGSFLALRREIHRASTLSTRAVAQRVLGQGTRVEQLLRLVQETLRGRQVVGVAGKHAYTLSGTGRTRIHRPAILEQRSSGAWLVDRTAALRLAPVFEFGLSLDAARTGPGTACRPARPWLLDGMDRRGWRYAPLGELTDSSGQVMVDVIRVPIQAEAASAGGRDRASGLDEARLGARGFVGRREELSYLRGWLQATDRERKPGRIGWLHGGPGTGKTHLLAHLAQGMPPRPERQVLYHSCPDVTGGEQERAFLEAIEGAVDAWGRDPGAAVVQGRPASRVLELASRLERCCATGGGGVFLAFVDAEDLFGIHDRVLEVIQQLAVPGTAWLLTGLPHQVGPAHTAVRGRALLAGGLPPMPRADLRQLMVERLLVGAGGARMDVGEVDEVHEQARLEQIVEMADGLPIFATAAADAWGDGDGGVGAGETGLPGQLAAYYEAALARCLEREADAGEALAVLALLEEAVTEAGLALVLAAMQQVDLDAYPSVRGDVERQLAALRPLVSRAPTSAGQDGLQLYHWALRTWLGGSADGLEAAFDRARGALFALWTNWRQLPEGALRNHLLMDGAEYALRLGWDSGAASRVVDEPERIRARAQLVTAPEWSASSASRRQDGMESTCRNELPYPLAVLFKHRAAEPGDANRVYGSIQLAEGIVRFLAYVSTADALARKPDRETIRTWFRKTRRASFGSLLDLFKLSTAWILEQSRPFVDESVDLMNEKVLERMAGLKAFRNDTFHRRIRIGENEALGVLAEIQEPLDGLLREIGFLRQYELGHAEGFTDRGDDGAGGRSYWYPARGQDERCEYVALEGTKPPPLWKVLLRDPRRHQALDLTPFLRWIGGGQGLPAHLVWLYDRQDSAIAEYTRPLGDASRKQNIAPWLDGQRSWRGIVDLGLDRGIP